MLYQAFMAGVWSSLGSTIGKLSGMSSIVGESYILWAILIVIMVLSNTWGCRCYLLSLDAATNSVLPTVIASASSYILSGILGVVLFNEVSTFTWWLGIGFIIQGFALIAHQQK